MKKVYVVLLGYNDPEDGGDRIEGVCATFPKAKELVYKICNRIEASHIEEKGFKEVDHYPRITIGQNRYKFYMYRECGGEMEEYVKVEEHEIK